jgi:hypothetical protein
MGCCCWVKKLGDEVGLLRRTWTAAGSHCRPCRRNVTMERIGWDDMMHVSVSYWTFRLQAHLPLSKSPTFFASNSFTMFFFFAPLVVVFNNHTVKKFSLRSEASRATIGHGKSSALATAASSFSYASFGAKSNRWQVLLQHQ